MIFFFGFGDKLRTKAYVGARYCMHCGSFQHYYLYKNNFQFTLFFIPVFWWTKGYHIGCGKCHYGQTLSKEEGMMMEEKYQNHVDEKTMEDIFQYLSMHANGMSYTEESRQVLYDRYRNKYTEMLDKIDRKEIEIMIDQILMVKNHTNQF